MSYGTYQPLPLSEVLAHAIRCAEGDQNVHKRYYLALDDLRRIQSALATLPEDAGWRPIESAPKDGTRIAIKFASGREYEANWQTTYGGEWHVDSFTHLPWSDQNEIVEWRTAAPATGQEG